MGQPLMVEEGVTTAFPLVGSVSPGAISIGLSAAIVSVEGERPSRAGGGA